MLLWLVKICLKIYKDVHKNLKYFVKSNNKTKIIYAWIYVKWISEF